MPVLAAMPALADPRWGAAWIVSILALLLGLAGRRRLPTGVGDGLFAAGLSGLLFAAYLPMHDPQQAELQLSAVLTALAVLWRFAPRWTERNNAALQSGAGAGEAIAPDAGTPVREVSEAVAANLVLLCGVAVAGISLRLAPEEPRPTRLAVTLCLMILVALTLRPRAGASIRLSRYALLGLLACALRIWLLPRIQPDLPHGLAPLLLLTGAAVLVVAVIPILTYWRFRRRLWQTQPQQLLKPPSPLRRYWAGVLVLSGLIGIAALLVPEEPLAPLAAGLACLAASIAGYRQASTGGGTLALALACETAVMAALAWLRTFGFNALLGATLAGLWMLWLARFWKQQLLDGQPWTAAGRLIPAAGELAYAAAVVCAALAIAVFPPATPWLLAGRWSALFTVALLLLLFSMLVRYSVRTGGAMAAFVACLTLLTAIIPAQRLLELTSGPWSWPALLTLAAVLLVLRIGPQRESVDPHPWVYNSFLGAFLPFAVAYMIALGWTGGHTWLGFAMLVVWLAILAWRWRRPGVSAPVSK